MGIISQGAEAILSFEDGRAVKHRLKKNYRIDVLDNSLRRSRQRKEAKVIERLQEAGIAAPKVISSDEESMKLHLQFIDGPKIKDVIATAPQVYGKAIGLLLAGMHNAGIAHGDPTTSNFIACTDGKVYAIDFGLSFFTKKREDFAVDLHLLRQVLEATHTQVAADAWRSAIDAYATAMPEARSILDWLETRVEKRGRNKR